MIEGSLIINIFDEIDDAEAGYKDRLIAGNLTFPSLREVTDFFVLYSTEHIKTLATLFPHLTVIRGNRLIKVCFRIGERNIWRYFRQSLTKD